MGKTMHSNPLWRFRDARGVERAGHIERTVDFGGTDQTFFFRDCASGELLLVSGQRLREARRLWHSCPIEQEREALARGEEQAVCGFCGEFIEVADSAVESTWQQWRCPCCGNWNDKAS